MPARRSRKSRPSRSAAARPPERAPKAKRKTRPRTRPKARPAARAASARALATYREKRRFDRTPEPSGAAAKRAGAGPLGFVVQKHAARRLHYDFRLELDGVLLSWAVPKGPSLSPSVRRLAVRTEDHPLEYAGFEGVIPEGEYGAGAVLVWDRGTWTPEGDPRAGLRKGHLVFSLDGKKLRGRWHLVRTRGDEAGRESWLLFKGRDESADEDVDLVVQRPKSVQTGRTIEGVKKARDRVWRSSRGAQPRGAGAAPAPRAPSEPGVLELVRKLPLGFALTNLEKVLYPEQGVRKAELVAYFASLADRILADLANRPLTLVRCPDGRHKSCFYQKHATDGVPAPVGRVEIREDDGTETYMTVRDLPGLVALAQLGALELHAWPCHADKVERPDQLVFDVDPDVGLGWEHVVEAALELRRRLEEAGLTSFVRTTGGKGLHVVAPLVRRHGWDEHKGFARALAEQMAAAQPDRYTTNSRKAQRRGRLFLDYLRNGRGATAIASYSTRAREGATVATPITWAELEAGVDPKRFTVYTVPRRIAEMRRDPWAGYFELRQSIPTGRARAAGRR